MKFIADLHIHSHFSRATSPRCDLPHLHAEAKRKGIAVVGTGDFTHPGWLTDLSENLEEAEEGLYRLRDAVASSKESEAPASAGGPVRFLLTAEISNIYKKSGRTRKNHNLILAPHLGAARAIHTALDRIGNVRSDGRPILGLDARDLLEIVLEAAPGAYLIPAHIWTPWFSLFGSKSGFDALEECFEDLSGHIFALETGLSSDPLMNWRLSNLDRYTLVSHSDAHSPGKLGREADLFDTELSFPAIRKSLETREGFLGTIEFFPEEGKYHLDGHRKCNMRMTPSETKSAGGVCPACGKPVTVGVMNRVDQLADRPEGVRPPGAPGFKSLVPLTEVLGECLDVGPGSKKVGRAYGDLIEKLGPELEILMDFDVAEIERASTPLIAEAIRRVREGKVHRLGGYDGEFGVIRVFEPGEKDSLRGQSVLFALPPPLPARVAEPASPASPRPLPLFEGKPEEGPPARSVETGLNEEQCEAVHHETGPLLIVAGPGTGKTRTVAHRIGRLVDTGLASPESVLAVTFTNHAAGEMKERIRRLLPDRDSGRVTAVTFHALCARLLREGLGSDFSIIGEAETAAFLERSASKKSGGKKRKLKGLAERISEAKRECLTPEEAGSDARFGPEIAEAYRAYQRTLESAGALDFDDLLMKSVRRLRADPAFLSRMRDRFPWIFVDEYQDINGAQYALVRLLAPGNANLCAIGDPDQSIYGFRGADPAFFRRFAEDYPEAKVIRLKRNYRSPDTILFAASQVMEKSAEGFGGPVASGIAGERIVTPVLASEKAEAEFVVHAIEKALGGVSFFSWDSGRVETGGREEARSFSDFAVLYRTEAQGEAVFEALRRLGIPFGCVGTNRLLDKPAIRAVYDRLKDIPAGEERTVSEVLIELAQAAPGPSADAARELAQMAGPFGTDIVAYRNHLALGSEGDAFDRRADRVACMTLHASKGLEFPVVFILACEDGVIPFRFGKRCDDIEEERRLFFVGVTRAKERLFLCRAGKRRRYGRVVENPPSPFLEDIEKELLERASLPEGKKKKPKGPKQLDLFG